MELCLLASISNLVRPTPFYIGKGVLKFVKATLKLFMAKVQMRALFWTAFGFKMLFLFLNVVFISQ